MELGPRLLPENKSCLDLIWVSRNVIATVRNLVCMCARLVCLLFSWNHGIEQTMCFAECIFTDHVSWIKCCWVPSDLSLKSVLQQPKTWVPFWIWSFEPDGSRNLQRKYIILNNSGQLCVESPSEFDLFCKHGKERKVYSHLYAYRSWRKRKPKKQSLQRKLQENVRLEPHLEDPPSVWWKQRTKFYNWFTKTRLVCLNSEQWSFTRKLL